jgi:F-box interacting protein
MAASSRSEKVMVPPMVDPSSENKVENPDFSKMFLKYHRNNGDDVKFLFNINFKNLKLLSGDKFRHEEVLDMDLPSQFVDNNKHLGILGSALDGLVCLYDFSNQKNIILWNPAYGQKRVLPTNYAAKLGSTDDNITNIHVHGFGYDLVTRDFKVIQYVIYDNVDFGDDDETKNFWQVYCLHTNKWTKLNIPSGHQIPFLQYNPNGLEVYLEGFFLWLGRVEAYGQLYLVSFNLEAFNLIDYNKLVTLTPMNADVTESFLKLVVLNRYVAMITQHDDPMSFSISILGKMGVKESWTTSLKLS